jgi:hypothetical protein
MTNNRLFLLFAILKTHEGLFKIPTKAQKTHDEYFLPITFKDKEM